MVFNATFNNISATCILWRSVLKVEDTWVPRENHRSAASHWQTLSYNVVSSTPRLSQIRTHNVPAYDKCKYIFKQCLFCNTFLATNNVNNLKQKIIKKFSTFSMSNHGYTMTSSVKLQYITIQRLIYVKYIPTEHKLNHKIIFI
jgi:hypothetical protein